MRQVCLCRCLDPRTECECVSVRSLRQECATDTARFRVLLNRESWNVGKYLVYRLYKEEELMLKGMTIIDVFTRD